MDDDDEFGGETQVHLFLFHASCCNQFLSSLAIASEYPGIPRYSKNLHKLSPVTVLAARDPTGLVA